MRRTVITDRMKDGRERTILMEEYRTFDELLKTNESRPYNHATYMEYKREPNSRFHGVDNHNDAVEMLRYGYAPDLKQQNEKVSKSIKTMDAVKTKPKTDIVGYMPHVPNAIIGIPQQMINNQRTYRRSKVVKMIVDIGVLGSRSKEEVNEWGIQLVTKIVNLEMQGYRVRLEYLKTFSNDRHGEMYLLRVQLKSENNSFDMKRMSYPLTHASMQRAIAWDWYERLPDAGYLSGFGQSLSIGDYDATLRREFIEKHICDKDTHLLCIFDNIDEKLMGLK